MYANDLFQLPLLYFALDVYVPQLETVYWEQKESCLKTLIPLP